MRLGFLADAPLDTTVVTHRFHAGHELVIEERLRMVDGTQLSYCHKVTGPDGTTDRHEVTFSVESK